MKSFLLALIRAYQYVLSPWVGGSCRYWPTCSEYAREAIVTHGAAYGSWLALRRLARCHPYGRGGVDPVPPVPSAPPAHGAPGACACGSGHHDNR
jgi:hypothetical protein